MTGAGPVATFDSLDDAESALDWIGIGFGEAEDAFEGVLTEDDRDALVEARDDGEAPDAVRRLAADLLGRLDAGETPVAWRVAWRG